MNNLYVFKPILNESDVRDAIVEKITKAQAMTSCLLATMGSSGSDFKVLYGVVLALDDYLEEIDCLFTKLDELSVS